MRSPLQREAELKEICRDHQRSKLERFRDWVEVLSPAESDYVYRLLHRQTQAQRSDKVIPFPIATSARQA
jgi:hypothetical protein